MKFKTCCAALGMAALSAAQASAATIFLTPSLPDTDIGVLAANNTYVGTVAVTGAFSHKWIFDITTPLFSGGSVNNVPITFATGLGITTLADISGLSVQLYSGSGTLIIDLDTNPGSNANVKVGSGIFPVGTDYYFKVSGTGVGMGGMGNYSFTVTTLPVPELETWAMLVAGIGMVALQLRRKSRVASKVAIN